MNTASASVFVGWEARHAALFTEVRARFGPVRFFPLNQKAASTFLEAGGELAGPHFWDMQNAQMLAAAEQEAHSFAARWHEPSCRPNRLRAFMWAREAAYIRRLLAAFDEACGKAVTFVAPRRADRRQISWHGTEAAAETVFAEREQQWPDKVCWVEDDAHRPAFLLPPDHLVFSASEKLVGGFSLVSTFGIPDLADRLSALLRESAGALALLLDRTESGPLALIYEQAEQSGGRIRLIPPIIEHDETAPAPAGSGLLGEWITQTAEIPPALLKARLAPFLQKSLPDFCLISDHDCPQTQIIMDLCAQFAVPLRIMPHSVWPLKAPFLVDPTSLEKAMFFVSGRRARRHLAAQSGLHVARIAPLPASPRWRLTLRRTARVFLKLLRPSRPKYRIGIAMTSGEAVTAPDTPIAPLAQILGRLLNPPKDMRDKVVLYIRLRPGEDQRPFLSHIIQDTKMNIHWETSTDRTPVAFLRQMDILVELGAPGSITYESFAEMTPVVRTGSAEGRCDFLFNNELVPRLDEADPWASLAPIVRRGGRRRLLAFRQWLFLLSDGMHDMFQTHRRAA